MVVDRGCGVIVMLGLTEENGQVRTQNECSGADYYIHIMCCECLSGLNIFVVCYMMFMLGTN